MSDDRQDDGGLIAEVPKNARELIRLRHTTFNGVSLVDARVWTLPAVPGSESKPTKKGLTLRRETWAELLAALSAELADADETDDQDGAVDGDADPFGGDV